MIIFWWRWGEDLQIIPRHLLCHSHSQPTFTLFSFSGWIYNDPPSWLGQWCRYSQCNNRWYSKSHVGVSINACLEDWYGVWERPWQHGKTNREKDEGSHWCVQRAVGCWQLCDQLTKFFVHSYHLQTYLGKLNATFKKWERQLVGRGEKKPQLEQMSNEGRFGSTAIREFQRM